MDYRYLKAFILTAQHLSFSKAAEELKIAQSAVSRQIKMLEESIGEELIVRSSKKVILTINGRELFMAAQHFDKSAHDIFHTEDKRPVNIGMLHGLLNNWFSPRLSKYYKKSRRNMNIIIADQKELRQGIEDGRFDIIFSTENIQSELISSLKLFDENLVIISKEDINKKKIHEYRWVVYSNNDYLFQISKKKSDTIIRVQDIHTIVDLVKSQVGIAIVPDHVLKKSDNLIVQDVLGLEKSEIYMTTLNYKSMPDHISGIQKLL